MFKAFLTGVLVAAFAAPAAHAEEDNVVLAMAKEDGMTQCWVEMRTLVDSEVKATPYSVSVTAHGKRPDEGAYSAFLVINKANGIEHQAFGFRPHPGGRCDWTQTMTRVVPVSCATMLGANPKYQDKGRFIAGTSRAEGDDIHFFLTPSGPGGEACMVTRLMSSYRGRAAGGEAEAVGFTRCGPLTHASAQLAKGARSGSANWMIVDSTQPNDRPMLAFVAQPGEEGNTHASYEVNALLDGNCAASFRRSKLVMSSCATVKAGMKGKRQDPEVTEPTLLLVDDDKNQTFLSPQLSGKACLVTETL